MLTTHYMDEAERLCDRWPWSITATLGTPTELIARLGASTDRVRTRQTVSVVDDLSRWRSNRSQREDDSYIITRSCTRYRPCCTSAGGGSPG